jgi:hypothetical protein
MSTRAVFLPESASFPTTNYPALLQDGQSRLYLAFDATTNETCYWTFIAPQGFTGTKTLVVTYRAASATTGTALFDAAIEAISDGDATDTDAASSFATDNTPTAVTVPGTAGYIDQLSITLTNDDSIAVGDYCRLRLNRDNADTAAGDLHVLAAELRDAA